MTFKSIKSIALVLACGIATLQAAAQGTTNLQVAKYMEEARSKESDKEYLAVMKSADSFARKTNDIAAQALVAEVIGGHYYTSDANKSITHLQKANRLYTQAGNSYKATTCLQNIAFAYQEQKKDNENAMKYARRALNARIQMKDTAEMANMYKYIAFLYGKMRNLPQAKRNAASAAALYTSRNMKDGLAVTWRNLGIAFEEAHETDSAIKWIEMAEETWKASASSSIQSRIYTWNNDLIRLYAKAKRVDDAAAKIKENESMDAANFHYSNVLAFYKESKSFYAHNRNKEAAREYKAKYDELRKTLKKEGKNVD